MLETRDTWEHQDREDQRDLQESQAKTENLAQEETPVKLDSPDQRAQEDFLARPVPQASRVTGATMDH